MAKVVKLPSGNYRVQYFVNGKRFSKTFTDEYEAKLFALKYTHKMQAVRIPANMTLGEAIDDYCAKRSHILSPTTLSEYKRIRNKSLRFLIDVKITKITNALIQEEINQMAETLSPKTIRNHIGLLKKVMVVYCPDFKVSVDLPQKEKTMIEMPDVTDIEMILKAVKGADIEIPVLLALWLGLRMSEILGLKRSDIKGDYLYVTRARVTVDGELVEKNNKTTESKRALFLPKYIKDLINKTPKKKEYIVNLTRAALYMRYKRMLEKIGLPSYRFHDLRHMNASIMLMLNVPNKYAMERMGHATPDMLNRVYQHTFTQEKMATVEKINLFFEKRIAHENAHDQNSTP